MTVGIMTVSSHCLEGSSRMGMEIKKGDEPYHSPHPRSIRFRWFSYAYPCFIRGPFRCNSRLSHPDAVAIIRTTNPTSLLSVLDNKAQSEGWAFSRHSVLDYLPELPLTARMQPGRTPNPKAMQQLVTAWKVSSWVGMEMKLLPQGSPRLGK
jgi:hypothetical protein